MASNINIVPFLKLKGLRLVTPTPDASVPQGVPVLGYLKVGVYHEASLLYIFHTTYEVLGS
jgi:hypothetical protein